MLTDLYNSFEIDNDNMMELPEIGALHNELINESILDQIENPFESRVNFVDDYFNTVNKQLELNDENPETYAAIRDEAISFCLDVLKLIDKKFDLDLDDESLLDKGLEEIKTLTYAAYEFFVIHYYKNLKKFFVKYIIMHLDDINDIIGDNKDRNDVVSNAMKVKVDDPRMANVLSNLKMVINYIDSLELDGSDILDVFNQDKYEIFVLNSAIGRSLISASFGTKFFSPVTKDYFDDAYNDIFLSIQSSLMRKFVKIEDGEDEDE